MEKIRLSHLLDLSNTIISVSLKVCIVWLVNHLKEEFHKWRHTDRQLQIDCLTATFAVKERTLIDHSFRPHVIGN